jgi:hypothetical protein
MALMHKNYPWSIQDLLKWLPKPLHENIAPLMLQHNGRPALPGFWYGVDA